MKQRIGKFLFDLVVRYIDYLDDEHYDRLRNKTYRPAWSRRIPLPVPDGRTWKFMYTELAPPVPPRSEWPKRVRKTEAQ